MMMTVLGILMLGLIAVDILTTLAGLQPAAASGLTCPMHAPAVPPEKRPDEQGILNMLMYRKNPGQEIPEIPEGEPVKVAVGVNGRGVGELSFTPERGTSEVIVPDGTEAEVAAVVTEAGAALTPLARASFDSAGGAARVAEALGVALLMDGGTASVYGPRAFDAFREFAEIAPARGT